MTESSEARLYNLNAIRSANSNTTDKSTDCAQVGIAKVINLRNRGLEISQQQYDESLRLSKLGFKKKALELGKQSGVLNKKAKSILIFKEV